MQYQTCVNNCVSNCMNNCMKAYESSLLKTSGFHKKDPLLNYKTSCHSSSTTCVTIMVRRKYLYGSLFKNKTKKYYLQKR